MFWVSQFAYHFNDFVGCGVVMCLFDRHTGVIGLLHLVDLLNLLAIFRGRFLRRRLQLQVSINTNIGGRLLYFLVGFLQQWDETAHLLQHYT